MQDLDQGVATGIDPEHMAELACRDQDAAGRDEAGDHGMREEIRQEAEPEQAHDQQDAAGKRSQEKGCGQIPG